MGFFEWFANMFMSIMKIVLHFEHGAWDEYNFFEDLFSRILGN